MPVSLSWLRRRDPSLSSLRRAVRVALVACTGFYACRYGLHNPAMATYALFGTIALGALSQLNGSGAEQSRTLLAALPAGAVLVTAGTLLSVTTWTATLGMFVLGFLVSYVGVGGPRLVGLASGMQLLYILPCFPPYDPGSLGYRLAGLVVGVLLLAAANVLLWPDPRPQVYRQRLADAADVLADALHQLAGSVGGPAPPDGATGLAGQLTRAFDASESIRPSKAPPA
ncbi:MAG TPA: FUSC family membrane protein, partial [Rugosimonospora sp.]|nr:FUSC family membrane protein [Rugosimonospora sp.]